MAKSLLRSIIKDQFDIELIGWIKLMVGAISIIFGMMAALAEFIAQMNGYVVGRLLLFVTIGILSIWLGSRAMRGAKTGSIRNQGDFTNMRPLT